MVVFFMGFGIRIVDPLSSSCLSNPLWVLPFAFGDFSSVLLTFEICYLVICVLFDFLVGLVTCWGCDYPM